MSNECPIYISYVHVYSHGLQSKTTKELKKQWDMKVMVSPIVIGALGAVNKGLIKRIEDREI